LAGRARLNHHRERRYVYLDPCRPPQRQSRSVPAVRTRRAEVEARLTTEGLFPPSWYSLLVIAGLIGAIGILTNSEILIVGAMVVGPEYGAILSLAFGVTRRDFSRVGSSAAALGLGFGLAVVAALLLSLVVRWAGIAPAAYTLGNRPVSALIDTPQLVLLRRRGPRRRAISRRAVGLCFHQCW
jgi:hypothetical protein